jgi:hypothetical protein
LMSEAPSAFAPTRSPRSRASTGEFRPYLLQPITR